MNLSTWTVASLEGINFIKNNDRQMGARKAIFPKDEYTNWLSISEWESMNTHIQVTLCVLNRLYL